MNGQTVEMGDRIDEALVIKIGPTNVTLELNGQRKSYNLN